MPFEFDIPKEKKSIIKVIGVGGGGSNAVSHMFRQGIIGVDFAICNTDIQSIESSPVPTKIQLGPLLTDGRGAGSKPSVGKQACIESIDDVRRFLEDNTKMLFITAGMGGGTGTGAAPIIAQTARELGILTVGIVTVPFTFEGRKRETQAAEGLEEMKSNVDALIVVSNDKLREIHGNLVLSEAFSKADNILTTAAKGIAEIITVPGYVNVDFEDVNTVMRESGVAIMGTATAEGEDRAKNAVEEALNSPLLEENDIRGARHILLNISSGTREVTMDEIFEITNYVQEEAGFGTDLIWGNCTDEALKDKLCVTVIATGFEGKRFGEKTEVKEKKIMVSLDEFEQDFEVSSSNATMATSQEPQVTTQHTPVQQETTQVHVNLNDYNTASQSTLTENERRLQREAAYMRKLASRQNQRESLQTLTKETIHSLEKEPAYKRKRVVLDDVPEANESQASRWSITDEDQPALRKKNSFLHDNVD